jgi:hypothetical protein
MLKIEQNNLVGGNTRSGNEGRNESLPFPGYPHYSPEGGKRIDGNLEDAYDRLRNNNMKISSRLKVSTVSSHLELVYSRYTNSADATKEDLQQEMGSESEGNNLHIQADSELR